MRTRLVLTGMGWFPDQPGGLNRYLTDYTAALAERSGTRFQVVTVGPIEHPPPYVHAVSSRAAPLPQRMLAVARATTAARPTVLDVHFALYGLPVVLRHPRTPLMVHFHGPWADEVAVETGRHDLATRARHALEAAVYRRADRLVVLSQAFADVLEHRYGIDPDRIRIIAPGVDLAHFTPGDRAIARAGFGITDDRFVVACARRHVQRVGIDVLVRAWADVVRAHPDALLLLAGNGPEHDALQALAAEQGVANSVHFLGRVTDEQLVELYRAADLTAVPTRSLEGFGLVVVESLACGTPCLVTDVGGLPEIMNQFCADLVVPPDDPAALAARITAAAAGHLPTREASRAHAERYRWDVAVDAHLRELDAITGRHARRIAVLDHTAKLSGGELALARTLPAMPGIDPTVILFEHGPLEAFLDDRHIRHEVIALDDEVQNLRRDGTAPRAVGPRTVLATLGHVLAVRRRLRELQPDIVHANSLKGFVVGALAARSLRLPLVWHVRDRIADDYLPRPTIRLLHALARLTTDAVVANSTDTLSTVCGITPIEAVVPSPIELERHDRVARTDGRVILAMVGRLAPWKGQLDFVRALAASTTFRTGTAHAVIAGSALFGEDDYAAQLAATITELGLDDRVQLLGFVDDVPGLLAGADVLVHCSTIPEPFGQVVAQAMAAGCAVVAPDRGGPAELIEHGRTGLLFPMGDVGALGATIDKVLGDPDLRAALGTAAPAGVDHLGADQVGEQLQAVYDAVLRRRGRRGRSARPRDAPAR